jgi:hypothetical protein
VKPAAFVVDTNVPIAGLLLRDAASPVARVLEPGQAPAAQRTRFSISVAIPIPDPRHMLITA